MWVLPKTPRGLLQYFIAYVMSERGVDVMNVAEIYENQREVPRPYYRGNEPLELALSHDAVRQTGERVVIDMMGNVGLALRDVPLHRVERQRQAAELIAARHVNRGLVVSLLNAARRKHELANRPRRAPS